MDLRLGPPRQLLEDARRATATTHTLASLVARDEPGGDAGPADHARAARRSPPCSTRDRRRTRATRSMLELLESWRAAGSSRLDRDLDDAIDDPGAAIMDAAWPRIADAVMSPVLGPQLDQLASLITRDENARNARAPPTSGLVRLRRQGSAHAARAAGARARSGRGSAARAIWRLPRVAVGGDRRRRERSWRPAGPRPGELARVRVTRADRVPAGHPPDHDALDEPADVPAGDLLRKSPIRGP